VSEPEVYEARERLCDLGYLRQCYRMEDGSVGYRCPGEPIEDFLRKGGTQAETVGRKCVCNGLVSTVGFEQRRRDGGLEPPLVTAGDDATDLQRFVQPGRDGYSAGDVIDTLLGQRTA
jgi:nitronate monooxygenase